MAPHADRLVNPVMARMQAGEVALGMPVRLARSGDIARIAKTTGHDFIFIDCQHSLFNLETIGHIASTALDCGIVALVRVRGIDDPDVSLLLDNGVMGIVYPDVNTAAHAHQRRDAAAERGARDVADGLEIEQRMLAVDKDEVVPCRLGNAGDIARARQPHRHAERDIACLHACLDRVNKPVRVRRHGLAYAPLSSCDSGI